MKNKIEEEQILSYAEEYPNHYTLYGNVIIKFEGKEHEIHFKKSFKRKRRENEVKKK